MYPNYRSLEMVLLLLFSHLKCDGPLSEVQSCSRNRSHIVRLVIQKKILPIFHQYKISVPLNCPFHNARDVLWWPDVQKHYHDEKWVCPACEKAFSEEDHLIQHWDEMHMQYMTSQKEDSVCLESMCDIFRCNVLSASFDSAKNNHSSTSRLGSSLRIGENPICNENDLISVQKKCKNVITQCLVGVLAAFSAKDFHDMEGELDAVLCSYLTCQRYWDGSFTEIHHVPVLLCFILILLLSGIFFICYQTVWLVLKHSPSVIENTFCNGYSYPEVNQVKFRSKSRSVPRHQRAHLFNNNIR